MSLRTRSTAGQPFTSINVRTTSGGAVTDSSYTENAVFATTIDEVPANPNCQRFNMTGYHLLGGHTNGTGLSGSSTVQLINYIPGSLRPTQISNRGFSTFSLLPADERNALYTQLVAQTNFGRAETNLPVYLAELREVPSLIRLGKDLLKAPRKFLREPIQSASRLHLAGSFGLKPLLSDVKAMLNSQQLIERRVAEINNALKTGCKATTRKFFQKLETVGSTNIAVDQWGTNILRVSRTFDVASSVWGHVKWYPGNHLAGLSPRERIEVARAAVFDAGLSVNDLWEIIPWSFLVDYFTNTQEVLEITGNLIPGTSYRGAMMQRLDVVGTFTPTSQPVTGVQIQPIRWLRTIKSRFPGGVDLHFDGLELLTQGQLANISALILAGRKYRTGYQD